MGKSGIVGYFIKRPLVCNILLITCFLAGAITWTKIGKEELPEFAMPWIRVLVPFPGATAEIVEEQITKPLERELAGLSGIAEVVTTSSPGTASFRISFDLEGRELEDKILEVKEKLDRVRLPSDAEEITYRRWASAEKAIIDIAIYDSNVHLLNVDSRTALQKHVLAFINQISSLPEISSVDRSGYLDPEIEISASLQKLKKFQISLTDLKREILKQQIRMPLGTIEDDAESRIIIHSPNESIEALSNTVLRTGFSSPSIFLKDVATISNTFKKSASIHKINGREAIVLNIKKSSSTDILMAQKAVMNFIDSFLKNSQNDSLKIIAMDDESYEIRNRLGIIASNGILGFLLIFVALFIFMDARSGIWVAMGIPFSLSFTLLVCYLMGYTVNNMTLAGIIIVIGIVVDDAIIVAENIDRYLRQGLSKFEAGVKGTREVLLPIFASILTTCAAFLPLYFFEGYFGVFVRVLPAVIILMLFASLIESVAILPNHISRFKNTDTEASLPKESTFKYLQKFRDSGLASSEKIYAYGLKGVLKIRYFFVLSFLLVLGGTLYLFVNEMKFVMFPREETTQISVSVKAPKDIKKHQMAEMVRAVEDIFLNDPHNIVKAVRTRIGLSRFGGQVRENRASMRIEILPSDQRKISLNNAMKTWKASAEELKQFTEIKFRKSRWGRGSGSPIEIEVGENDDSLRKKALELLEKGLGSHSDLKNVEIEQPMSQKEYILSLNKESIKKLDIDLSQMAETLRTYIQGATLYEISKYEEEIAVRLVGNKGDKVDIDAILSLRIANSKGYLVPISDLVNIDHIAKPLNISRTDFKRTADIYADLKEDASATPLEIAEYLEVKIFPEIFKQSPTTTLKFKGEIEDSRDSSSDFLVTIVLVVGLIYLILVFLYNSLAIPFVILSILPFGLIGVILAFYSHGMVQYGFFAVVGTIGMCGVVVNDAIVMVSKFIGNQVKERSELIRCATTRLRPVILTTLTTAVGIFPTAYGISGYDSMLAEMMMAMAWGLVFATVITLFFLPCIFHIYQDFRRILNQGKV